MVGTAQLTKRSFATIAATASSTARKIMADATTPAEVKITTTKKGCCAKRNTKLRIIFTGLVLLSIIINLDGGAVPAALLYITGTFDLSTPEVGLLGMLVYFGIGCGSLVVGVVLRWFSATRATQATLILNTAATCLFGMAQSKPMLLFFRVSIGLLQAIPAVYFPVWVDEFAPGDSATVWMAVIQAGAPLGIMSGYVFSGVVTSQRDDGSGIPCPAKDLTCGWRWPFYLQCGVLVVFSIAFLLLPKELYDLGADGKAPSHQSSGDLLESAKSGDALVVDVPSSASGEESTRQDSNDSQGRKRGDTLTEVVADRMSFITNYVTEALQPMAARPPLIQDSVVVENEALLKGLIPPTSPSNTGERSKRMEERMRRMSSTPAGLTLSQSERQTEDGPLKLGDATTGQSSGAISAPPNSSVGVSRMTDRMSMNIVERVSMRGPRITMADEGYGGRPRVISAVDLFLPVTPPTRDRGWSQESSVASPSSAPPFKPTLKSIPSGKNVTGAPPPSSPSKKGAEEAATAEEDPGPAPRSPIWALLTNGVYVCTVLSLCSLFFVVTGIQFWVTAYIVKVVRMDPDAVIPAFGATSIIAPILGVVCGGIFIDKIGGYKGVEALALTLKCCLIFSACAAACAISCAYIPKRIADPEIGNSPVGGFWACIGLIAITLVFGGAAMPAATGCIISVVRIAAAPNLRNTFLP